MEIVRYVRGGSSRAVIGVRQDGDELRSLEVDSVATLLTLPMDQLRSFVTSDLGPPEKADVRLLAPVDGLTEVWAAGVTYRRSREARMEESKVSDVYDRVYDADRPELFLKSPAWRTCGDGDLVGVRADSAVDVPEPELALVINAFGEVVGYSVCDDVSSRSIEGENPLYLPQAKIYAGSCALGPGIRPVWEVEDTAALTISIAVRRAGIAVWQDSCSTATLHRDLTELVTYLFRAIEFPHGAVLSTGTGLVPDLTFSLRDGDEIEVDIAGIGTLHNTVATGSEPFRWLAERALSAEGETLAPRFPINDITPRSGTS
jgi:2-dehydro-3-deoxy-D-arabinonate dehydratase